MSGGSHSVSVTVHHSIQLWLFVPGSCKHDACCRSWRSTYIDLHGYCHWTCQLGLIDGLRQLFQSYLTPGWVWPQADFVVSVPHAVIVLLVVSHATHVTHARLVNGMPWP